MRSSLIQLIQETISSIFEGRADDIRLKYYSQLPEEDFYKIIRADPTTPIKGGKPDKLGRYSQWLLRLYANKQLKLEDLYKATEYLEIFDRYKQQPKVKIKDINQIKSLPDLFTNIELIYQTLQSGQNVTRGEQEREIKSNEASKIYEDSKWVVIVPLSERAACYYGANTQWCTAAKENNMFDHYDERGTLYINIDKINNRKYQFHFEEGQFMDERDHEIDIKDFFTHKEQNGLRQFYANHIAEKNGNRLRFEDLILTIKDGKHVILCQGYDDFAQFFPGRMNRGFLGKVLRGDAFEMFDYAASDFNASQWKRHANAANLAAIKAIVAEHGDGDDIVEHISSAIQQAAAAAQSSADESEAYNTLVSEIHKHFGVIRADWNGDEQLVLECQKNTWEFFALITTASFGPHETNPWLIDSPTRDFYGGDIDEDYFNQVLSDKLHEW